MTLGVPILKHFRVNFTCPTIRATSFDKETSGIFQRTVNVQIVGDIMHAIIALYLIFEN